MFRRHPWLPIVLAFAGLAAASAALVIVAERHKPQPVPLEHRLRP
jgi:hypothetical protein